MFEIETALQRIFKNRNLYKKNSVNIVLELKLKKREKLSLFFFCLKCVFWLWNFNA